MIIFFNVVGCQINITKSSVYYKIFSDNGLYIVNFKYKACIACMHASRYISYVNLPGPKKYIKQIKKNHNTQ